MGQDNVRYYPKNRIKTNLQTRGGEFLLNGVEYSGLYYITYDQKAYTGATPYSANANLPLVPIGGLDVISRTTTSLSLQELTPYYPKPTDSDYATGYFYRYFGKRANQPGSIVEISRDNFLNIRSRNIQENDYLYQVFDILWKLTGPRYNDRKNKQYVVAGVYDTNKRIVESQNKVYPGLKEYIGEDYTKFAKISE